MGKKRINDKIPEKKNIYIIKGKQLLETTIVFFFYQLLQLFIEIRETTQLQSKFFPLFRGSI